MKKIFFIVCIIIVIVSIVLWRRSHKETIAFDDVVNVITTDLLRTVEVTGSVVPIERYDLSFETNGRVNWVGVSVGDRVKKGQKLITLEDDTLRAHYNEAEASLRLSKNDLNLARRNDRKWDDLKPEVRQSYKDSVSRAEATLSVVRSQFNNLALHSPIDGIISKQEASVGETVSIAATASVNPAIISVISENGFEIKAHVTESDITNLSVGQEATLTFDAFFRDKPFRSKIITIEPEATVIQDVIYYVIVLELLDADIRLKSGMSADISFEIEKRSGVIAVPSRIIKHSGQSSSVKIIGTDELPQERTVVTGMLSDDGLVEIVSGLTVGEKVTQ